MVVFTSGTILIYYSRIISSSSYPYSVKTTYNKVLYWPGIDRSNCFHIALYITDVDNVKSLFFCKPGLILFMEKVNFYHSYVSVQRFLPRMNSDYYISAIFLNDNDYFLGDSGYFLYTNLDSFHLNLNPPIKAIVHSSKMSSTKCYTYPTTDTPYNNTMNRGSLIA